jgi:hypothetical protein
MKSIHKEFQQLGKDRNQLTYKLLAILPEIYEKRIYKKHAASIFEYAGKYGGLSHGVVEKTLRLHKNLEGKPELAKKIATEGVHKVALIAKLATSETDKAWSENVSNMSKATLQEFAKEIRHKGEGPCEAAFRKKTIVLEGETLFLFEKLKKKLSKSEKISDIEVLKKLLEAKNSEDHAGRKVRSKKKLRSASPRCDSIPGDKINRYIPIKIKRKVIAEGKCSYPNCNKPYEHLHHQLLHKKSIFSQIMPIAQL